jgi:thiol-disulfide isomerase/thioredoxin
MKLTLTMILIAAFGVIPCFAAQTDHAAETVNQRYPNLASGALTYAKIAALPEGVLLKSEGVEIRLSEVQEVVSDQPLQVREMLAKNLFYVLEQEARGKLLLRVARNGSASPEQVSSADDQQLITAFIDKLTADVASTEQEQRAFYAANPQFFPGVPFDSAQPQIAQYLTQDKKQQFVQDYIRILGQTMTIKVSADWTKQQAAAAYDNPLDKTLRNGKPTVALFYAASPCCPDTMGPVLTALTKQFGNKLNTVTLNPGSEPVLAARYRVQGNPYLLIFEADGKEAFRQQGAMSQDEITAKLAEIGLR